MSETALPSQTGLCSSPNFIGLCSSLKISRQTFSGCIFFLDSRFDSLYIPPMRVLKQLYATLRYMPPWAAHQSCATERRGSAASIEGETTAIGAWGGRPKDEDLHALKEMKPPPLNERGSQKAKLASRRLG